MSNRISAVVESQLLDATNQETSELPRLILLASASAVLFAVGLVVTEAFGEFAVDVDLKPFFIPYLMIAVSRYGLPTLSVALGGALGEGMLDVLEGYELDDPIGFVGYVVGFTAFGWYVNEVSDDPKSYWSLAVGAILGALVQTIFEGFAFFVFEATVTPAAAFVSITGNTLTHGVVLGAIPLVLLYRLFRERMDQS